MKDQTWLFLWIFVLFFFQWMLRGKDTEYSTLEFNPPQEEQVHRLVIDSRERLIHNSF